MLIIALICLLKDAFAVNVALGKVASKCDIIDHVSVTDGIMKPILLSGPCRGYPYIAIDIEKCIVNYVIVFTGELYGDLLGQLGPFHVVNMADNLEIPCGSYPNSLILHDFSRGMRVNCVTVAIPIQRIISTFPMAEDLKISEIEVHTLGNNETGEVTIHRGCFERFITTRSSTSYSNIAKCRSFCTAQNSPLMALQSKVLCHCGIDYDFADELKLSRCNSKCYPNEKFCGGIYTYSVYIVNVQLPYFFGCAKIVEPAKTIYDNVTVARCLQLCSNFSYIWLTQNTCGCESAPLPDIDDVFQCTQTCSGDPTEFCGGIGYASVYSTCRRTPAEFLTCEKLMQCAKGYDQYGVCIGGCKSGFAGEYCMERVSDPVEEATRRYEEFSKNNVVASQGSKTLTKMNVILNLFCASLVLFLL